jgi:hypothetical protein
LIEYYLRELYLSDYDNSGSRNNGNVLFVSIAIGEIFKESYLNLFAPSHQLYCAINGYDYLLVDDFVDRHPDARYLVSFQKALVSRLFQSGQYNLVVYVDADVLVNTDLAPPISDLFSGHVLFVDEYTQPSIGERCDIQERMDWERSATDYYKLSGLNIETKHVLNTGVMVFDPIIHGPAFEKSYAYGRRHGIDHPRGFHFEQSVIGHEFLSSGNFELIDNRWNAIIALHELAGRRHMQSRRIFFQKFFHMNYFVHFAGRSYRGLEFSIMKIAQAQRELLKKFV